MTLLKRFLSILFFALGAIGVQGFNHKKYDSLPGSLHGVWESTFQISPKAGGMSGSAVIVRKDMNRPKYGEATLYLLTNAHVLTSNGCLGTGLCNGIQVSSSQGGDLATGARIEMDDRNRTFSKVNVAKISNKADLALLEVVIDNADSRYNSLAAAPLESNCNNIKPGQKVYFIGYPNLTRRDSVPGFNYEMRTYTIKRWSQGLIAAISFDTNRGTKTATTADALPGNSGGPAINENGVVISVVSSMVAVNDGDTGFKGDDKNSLNKPHGLIETCEALQIFRNE